VPHHRFVQTRGDRAMKGAKAAQPVAAPGPPRAATAAPRVPSEVVDRWSPEPGDRRADDVRFHMVRFLPRLRRFAHALTHNQDQSEDLVQETCARALARLDQWRPDTRLDSWMYRIAQNLWIDQMRAEKVKGEIVDIAAIEDKWGPDGRVVTEARLSLLELRDRIAQLPSEQRALLRLVCMDGLSYKEAAQALDSPAGTVMSRLARARRALHDAAE
jgi:RNA polymerase sigma-70 factor (ECF subfamily)